jgi:hypothetical protein
MVKNKMVVLGEYAIGMERSGIYTTTYQNKTGANSLPFGYACQLKNLCLPD